MENSKPAIKKGYKQTDVGIIPEDWEVKFCNEICLKIQDGTHFSPKLGGYDYLYVTSKNIGFGKFNLSDVEKIDARQHKNIYARCDVKKGDLLLTKDGANTGNATINHLTEEFSLLSSVAFLRFSPKNHDARFYLQYILSNSGQSRIKEMMSGNAITRLTLEKINKFSVPVPPLTEQEAIAGVLSDADALITSLDALLAKKRNIKQGTMSLLLTGKKRLPGFSGDWETKKLKEVAPLQRGFDLPNKELKKGIYPVVYSNGILNTHNEYKAKAPGIVTGRSGTIGKVNFIEQDYFPHNTSLWVTDFKGNYPKFIYYLYVSVKLERFGTGSGVPTLNRNDVHLCKISLPPTIEEQKAIARILSEMDAEIEALEARREKYKLLKQGLMQELLTGKTRLI